MLRGIGRGRITQDQHTNRSFPCGLFLRKGKRAQRRKNKGKQQGRANKTHGHLHQSSART